jgi:hypothetical protein
MRRLAVVFGALYVLLPKVMIDTFHIYVRMLPIAALFAIAALPVLRGNRWLPAAAVGLGLLAGANNLYRFLTIPEVDDALSIIDEIPAGKKLIGVTWEPTPATLNREIWVHLPAVYQQRKSGLTAYSFARNESPPIRYRLGAEPPRPPGGFEWDGGKYDPHAGYARYFDRVLVRSWMGADGAVVDPAAHVFKDQRPWVREVARRGRFFLYDASGLQEAAAESGTLP